MNVIVMNAASRQLIDVLHKSRTFLALPGNDFSWSSWNDALAALVEMDCLIAAIELGQLPPRIDLEVLFAPKGPIQEISLSSGWAYEFLTLSKQFDIAVEAVYNCSC